jgi:CubicO group peptidase (beta-lactamase class C family)
MLAYEKSRDFSGAVLVADRDGLVYRGGFGWANREAGTRITATTKFWIASVTKQFTAAAILQLAESGRLRLEGTIGEYLPEYPRKHAGRVTIEQLLTHTSGIPDYADRDFMASATAQTSGPSRLLNLFWERDLEFEPGSRFRYANSGYIVLGAIIERLTGKSWAAAMEDRIFSRLGMKDTGFDDLRQVVPERAAGYHLTYEGPENARQLDRSAAYAAGGLRSTVDDLYRWDRAIYKGQVVGDNWVDQMFRVREANYACGWAVTHSKVQGLKTRPLRTWHGGGAPGFSALITRFPEEHFLIVLLSNTDNGPSLREMTDRIAAFLYGSAVENPKPQISKVVYSAWRKSGTTAAVQTYRRLKETSASEYDFSEEELNSLGYYFLRDLKRITDAIAVLRLNVESFPASPNAHDSVAEACLANRQFECARTHFKTVLQLDAGNSRAKSELEKLDR